MPAFENRFSYSHSSINAFRTCPRSWWLGKVAFWNGWNRGSPEISRLAYRGSKMTGLYRLAGQAVHEVAARAVKLKTLDVDGGLSLFREAMERGWRESKSGRWKEDPKRVTNLFEHYYDGAGNPDMVAGRAFERGRAAVEDLFGSEILARARAAEVLAVEELAEIEVVGVPVFLRMDLVFREPGSAVVEVWDWKTGRPRQEDHLQAGLYALAAREIYRAEEIRVGIAYLGAGARPEQFEVGAEELEAARETVQREAAEIQALLDGDGRLNRAPATRFPRTETTEPCRWCDLFHACRGHQDLRRPDLVMEGFEP